MRSSIFSRASTKAFQVSRICAATRQNASGKVKRAEDKYACAARNRGERFGNIVMRIGRDGEFARDYDKVAWRKAHVIGIVLRRDRGKGRRDQGGEADHRLAPVIERGGALRFERAQKWPETRD